jgi:hypothetical protein
MCRTVISCHGRVAREIRHHGHNSHSHLQPQSSVSRTVGPVTATFITLPRLKAHGATLSCLQWLSPCCALFRFALLLFVLHSLQTSSSILYSCSTLFSLPSHVPRSSEFDLFSFFKHLFQTVLKAVDVVIEETSLHEKLFP